MSREITVYEKHTIPISKYPRINSEKEKTDKIIITFLINEKILREIYNSIFNAPKFYYECKEYNYIFRIKGMAKKYTAKEIIDLLNMNININTNSYQNIDLIDRYYITYSKIYPFYINLFNSIEEAKRAYFECRDFAYRVIPPHELYINVKSEVYSAYELMEINAFAQFLKYSNYIHELPDI